MKLLEWLGIHKIPYSGPTPETGRVSFTFIHNSLPLEEVQKLCNLDDFKLSNFEKTGPRETDPTVVELHPRPPKKEPPPRKKLVPVMELARRLEESPMFQKSGDGWRMCTAIIVVTKAANRKG